MAMPSVISFSLFLYQQRLSVSVASYGSASCSLYMWKGPSFHLHLLPDSFTANTLILASLQNSDSGLSVRLHRFVFILPIPVVALPNWNALVSVGTWPLYKVFPRCLTNGGPSTITTACHTWGSHCSSWWSDIPCLPFAGSSHAGILFFLSFLSFSQCLFAHSVGCLVQTPRCFSLPQQKREGTLRMLIGCRGLLLPTSTCRLYKQFVAYLTRGTFSLKKRNPEI